MSKIGKQILNIPTGTTVTLTDGILKVKGPKGELSRVFRDEIGITVKDGNITLNPVKKDIFSIKDFFIRDRIYLKSENGALLCLDK